MRKQKSIFQQNANMWFKKKNKEACLMFLQKHLDDSKDFTEINMQLDNFKGEHFGHPASFDAKLRRQFRGKKETSQAWRW